LGLLPALEDRPYRLRPAIATLQPETHLLKEVHHHIHIAIPTPGPLNRSVAVVSNCFSHFTAATEVNTLGAELLVYTLGARQKREEMM
jgi:hypothetical protein